MVNIGKASAIFDGELVAGLIVAIIIDKLFEYIATNVWTPLSASIWAGFHWDDLLVLVVDILGVVALSGSARRVFVYAFWFNLGFEIFEWLSGVGGYAKPF